MYYVPVHLIRPLLDFFPGEVDFDGVDFSSVIHLNGSEDKTQPVEFFFPIRMMRCFVNYDCTVPWPSRALARCNCARAMITTLRNDIPR